MSPFKPLLLVLALLLLTTGSKTRPVEIAKERFERLKPPIVQIAAAAH
jgi:hypothetical protein